MITSFVGIGHSCDTCIGEHGVNNVDDAIDDSLRASSRESGDAVIEDESIDDAHRLLMFVVSSDDDSRLHLSSAAIFACVSISVLMFIAWMAILVLAVINIISFVLVIYVQFL